MRRRREPSEAELALWSEVARSVRPLSGRKLAAVKKIALTASEKAADKAPVKLQGKLHEKPALQKPLKPESRAKPATAAPKPPSAFAPLEKRLRTALKRGTRPIEAVIDLHGLRQNEAHSVLTGFIQRSSARGAGLVLVVTGKGRKMENSGGGSLKPGSGYNAEGDERGVLRRLVPHWLQLPHIRPLVIGFEEAHQNHGGSGALYVRLSRAKGLGDLS